MVTYHSDPKFLHFLHHELELPREHIAVAVKKKEVSDGPLPMLLWQYGLVSLEQLERIFDWLEDQN
ncbi:MAG: DUF2949 domain-containing protein [Calothrix sp. MO_192.B10]|nr:DUF2949 domain-containing protein [Calothrix sp. MO_192.B10]MDJ0800677.1 DUF2949 domain-containing protein [Calothrix sp. MO_167.B12]